MSFLRIHPLHLLFVSLYFAGLLLTCGLSYSEIQSISNEITVVTEGVDSSDDVVFLTKNLEATPAAVVDKAVFSFKTPPFTLASSMVLRETGPPLT